MVRPQALMESVSANLHEFLHSIDAGLARPQNKFLRDGLVGLLRARRPVVCRMARKLRLRRCLQTTNRIDSSPSGVRLRTNRVTHWRDGQMASRWAAAAFDPPQYQLEWFGSHSRTADRPT